MISLLNQACPTSYENVYISHCRAEWDSLSAECDGVNIITGGKARYMFAVVKTYF